MLKTVSWVAPEVNAYQGQRGTTYYVNGSFADGSSFSVGKQDPGKAAEVHALLIQLVGKEADFTVEDRGKKNKNGQPIFTLKAFPGYEAPAFAGGGGGGGASVGSRRSPENLASEQRAMNRRTSLMQAVALGIKDPDEVLAIATTFDVWLNEALPKPGQGASLSSAPAPAEPGPLSSPAPHPSRGNAGDGEWTAPRAEGEAADSGPSTHQHTWIKSDIPGWLTCPGCGEARELGAAK